MPNFKFKKDPMSEHALNLALDSIVIVSVYPWTQGFRPMVSSAIWGKAPTARKLRGTEPKGNAFDLAHCGRGRSTCSHVAK